MILAFSTSSAMISVAAVSENGEVLWSQSRQAPLAASAACLSMLDQMKLDTGLTPADAESFAADMGPGSFTGVRVGVTLAKTFGFLYGKPVAGASSFDLISKTDVVALPSKKGEFFVRRPGQEAIRLTNLPSEGVVGFGPGVEPQVYPSASRFGSIWHDLQLVSATEFVPVYLIEPSISIPKVPYAVIAKPEAS